MENTLFRYKKARPEALEAYGFRRENNEYAMSFPLCDGFRLDVSVDDRSGVRDRVWDTEMDEEYVLYASRDAVGPFVAELREKAETVLAEICRTCFEDDVFRCPQTHVVIQAVRDIYGRELEFLWEDSKDCAIWRRPDNDKWFGVVMCINRAKLEPGTDERVEILNVRMDPGKLNELAGHGGIYRGWHMNKKSWCTVVLDGSLDRAALLSLLEDSYRIAGNRK